MNNRLNTTESEHSHGKNRKIKLITFYINVTNISWSKMLLWGKSNRTKVKEVNLGLIQSISYVSPSTTGSNF